MSQGEEGGRRQPQEGSCLPPPPFCVRGALFRSFRSSQEPDPRPFRFLIGDLQPDRRDLVVHAVVPEIVVLLVSIGQLLVVPISDPGASISQVDARDQIRSDLLTLIAHEACRSLHACSRGPKEVQHMGWKQIHPAVVLGQLQKLTGAMLLLRHRANLGLRY